jgi:hypothetical protein
MGTGARHNPKVLITVVVSVEESLVLRRGQGDGYRAESGLHFTDFLSDLIEKLGGVEMLPFGLHYNAGVENYSQDGGFHG